MKTKRAKMRRVGQYEEILFNLVATKSKIERRKLEGRWHLVVPCVMITEGVHNGSNGPGLYKAKDTARTARAWDHMPVVVYHPEKGSARKASKLNTSKVGVVLNTRWDKTAKKLRTQVWLDEERTEKVDDRILTAVNNGEMMEVSTGLFLKRLKKKGTWNGEKYTWVAKSQSPDHLAILPDQVGACSVKDGAGLLQMNSAVPRRQVAGPLREAGLVNKMTTNKGLSFSETTSQLSELLSAKYGQPGKYWRGYITDVYDDKVIFRKDYSSDDSSLLMQSYSVKGKGKVTLDGEPKKVQRVTQYETVGNQRKSYVRNDGKLVLVSNKGEKMLTVKKKARMVRRLIANSETWTEKDKKTLMGMPDVALKKVIRQAEAAEQDDDEPVVKNHKKTRREERDEPVVVLNKGGADPLTEKEALRRLPPRMRTVIRNGLKAMDRQKKTFIKTITTNANNPFTEKWLLKQDVTLLEGMAQLAGGDEDEDGMFLRGGPDFSGAVGSSSDTTKNRRRGEEDDYDEDDEDEGLPLPRLFGDDNAGDNADKKGKKKTA